MNIKDYFSFTRGEKRGAVVFIFIIIALIIANFSVDLLKKNTQTDFSEFEAAIIEFEKGIESRNSATLNSTNYNLFQFNPNTISDEEWSTLGFKPWQIKTINNYNCKKRGWIVIWYF